MRTCLLPNTHEKLFCYFCIDNKAALLLRIFFSSPSVSFRGKVFLRLQHSCTWYKAGRLIREGKEEQGQGQGQEQGQGQGQERGQGLEQGHGQGRRQRQGQKLKDCSPPQIESSCLFMNGLGLEMVTT